MFVASPTTTAPHAGSGRTSTSQKASRPSTSPASHWARLPPRHRQARQDQHELLGRRRSHPCPRPSRTSPPAPPRLRRRRVGQLRLLGRWRRPRGVDAQAVGRHADHGARQRRHLHPLGQRPGPVLDCWGAGCRTSTGTRISWPSRLTRRGVRHPQEQLPRRMLRERRLRASAAGSLVYNSTMPGACTCKKS